MGQPKLLEAKTRERPRYHDFKKADIMGHASTMDNLTYDPFPNAKNEDVVRREIIARELVLFAKFEGPIDSLKIGMTVNYGGHTFALQRITEHINTQSDICVMEVEGSCLTTQCQPVEVLAQLRKTLAAANNTTPLLNPPKVKPCPCFRETKASGCRTKQGSGSASRWPKWSNNRCNWNSGNLRGSIARGATARRRARSRC